jgi:DNA repair protein RadC
MTLEHAPGPRERALEGGVESLGDAELVAVVLGTGGRGEPVGCVAAALLDEHGGLGGLGRAGIGGMATRRGIGAAKAARLAAAFELGRRAGLEHARAAALAFPDSSAVDAWARPRLAPLEHEELWLLALDGLNGLRAARRVASGGLHGVHLTMRDPLRIALREGASAFLLVHNHPSGDPSPSDHDVAFSKSILEASMLVGTPMLDHVIVGRTGSSSMLDLGVLGPVLSGSRRPGSPARRRGRA